jgi:hypothetical protein
LPEGGNSSSNNKNWRNVSFAMELHSRYPEPCPRQHEDKEIGVGGGYTSIRWRLYDHVLEYDNIACPYDGDNDYPAVLLWSIAVSVLGAAVTLRHVSAVARWV